MSNDERLVRIATGLGERGRGSDERRATDRHRQRDAPIAGRSSQPPSSSASARRLPRREPAGPRPVSSSDRSEPNASRYRSTSSSVAGTGHVGPAPDDGFPHPAVRQVDPREQRERMSFAAYASSAFRGMAGANVTPDRGQNRCVVHGSPASRMAFSMPSARRAAQHVRVDVRVVGQHRPHRRPRGRPSRAGCRTASRRSRCASFSSNRPSGRCRMSATASIMP